MTAFLYLSLYTAASAGTLTDDLLDRKIGTALLSSIAYTAGFLAVIQWAILEISYEVMGLAALCVLACVWDVWSSFRAARSAWKRGSEMDADAEVIGVVLMLGARVPAYALAALAALEWIS
ncbi:MAG TPA: hypothetical protein VFG30_34600 [Polyangiales bacterium]|nr:hypothetical protein [Polyangiales bacterium]